MPITFLYEEVEFILDLHLQYKNFIKQHAKPLKEFIKEKQIEVKQ